jgi:hypothetical protein
LRSISVALSLHNARIIMRKSILLALLISSVLPACTSQTEDELGKETAADGEDGKGDGTAAFTFYYVYGDLRACSLNTSDCGVGFFAQRVNRSETQCGRGVASTSCHISLIDWTPTAMPASLARDYENSLRTGSVLMLRGSILPSADDGKTLLSATEIWVPTKSEAVDGVFTIVKDNGIRCVRAPCPSLTERRLNSNLSAQISGIDFDASGASQSKIDLARNDLYDDGVIVVGYRDTDSAGGKVRTANNFYTRAPVPLR